MMTIDGIETSWLGLIALAVLVGLFAGIGRELVEWGIEQWRRRR